MRSQRTVRRGILAPSTLLGRLAGSFDSTVLDLDDPTTRALVRDDLSFYVSGRSPMLVDEFQHVPELLDAIKAELNKDPRPGRFLLTGSTRYSALPRTAQSLTGRVHVVPVWPLAQGESAGRSASFLSRLAAQTGQVLNIAAASRAASITASVGEDYTRLLESVFLLHRLPAWGTTLSGRVNRLPKVHLVDSGLGGWLLGVTPRGVSRRIPAVLAELGHLLETFVVNELLKQASWLDRPLRVGHYRTSDGHEVDVLTENEELVAVAVKAGGSYRREDLRGLAHLRDQLGDRFLGGVLMYTGERAAHIDDRIHLTPVDGLWEA